jgi:hypothetical protein
MLHSYTPFQSKKVVQLIHQSFANTACAHHPHVAKTDKNYAEGKVRSGDPVESDATKYSPNSEVSDEDQERKPKAVKTKSPSQKQPANDIVDGDEEEDEEVEVSIIGL